MNNISCLYLSGVGYVDNIVALSLVLGIETQNNRSRDRVLSSNNFQPA